MVATYLAICHATYHLDKAILYGLKNYVFIYLAERSNKINYLTLVRLSVFLFEETRLGEARIPDRG